MNPDRLNQIETVARELLHEVEEISIGFPHGGAHRILNAEVIRDPMFIPAARLMLDQAFWWLRSSGAKLDGHQEIELEAAGLVQSVLKRMIVEADHDLRAVIISSQIATKFRRFTYTLVMAPPNTWVPSLADQRAGAKPIPGGPGGGEA